MYVRTIMDMKEAAVALQHGKLKLDDLKFADFITDSIQFETSDWGSGNVITYKAAEYVIAIQKDLLAAYNKVYGTSITMSQLDGYKFLMVGFAVENRSIKITTRLSGDFVGKLFRDMYEADRVRDILVVALGASANISVLGIERVAETGAFHEDDILAVREFACRKTAGKVLIGNVGTGSVYYNGDRKYTKDDLKVYQSKPARKKELPPAPYDIDNRYMVLRYDFDKQSVYLANPECDPFWASTELLTMARRDILKTISDMAIDTGIAQAADLLITANVINGKISNAVVMGINLPKRDGARPLGRILRESESEDGKEGMHQASLLDF